MAVLASAGRTTAQTFTPGTVVGTLTTPDIAEASGLCASRQNPGVLWTHNDSSSPWAYALLTNAALLSSQYIPGAFGNLEDIAIGPGPSPELQYIFLGDIGDNLATRQNIRVFRFPEPAIYAHAAANPSSTTAAGAVEIALTYPDGPFNAEALMVDPVTGDLFIATKDPTRSRIYRASRAELDAATPFQPIRLSFVREISFFKVSAGDISPDGRLILLRKGNTAAVWNRRAGQSIGDALGGGSFPAPVIGEPAELNGEAIGFHPTTRGYYTLGEGFYEHLYYFRRVDTGVPRQPVVFINPAETWRYRDLGTDEGTAWRQPAYDDAAWAQGPAPLGYGEGDEQTTVSYGPSSVAKRVTTYFRKTFTVGNEGLSRNLALRLCFNDGVAVYLNGVEVLRRNLAADAPYNALATDSNASLQNYWHTFTLGPGLVQAGTNTIAVELHRQALNGPTLSFDLQLIEGAFDVNPLGATTDTAIPRVIFTTPAANLVVTNETLAVRGTAGDIPGVTRVEWKVNAGNWQAATGTTAWTAEVPLAVGTNIVSAVAYDARTNSSVVATRKFVRLATSRLTLEKLGQGTVTPNLDGTSLIVGNPFTVTATPAAGYLFAGWTGDVATNATRLRFLMQSNLVLRANFVPNTFIARKGVFRGLFEDTNHVSHESSGALTATLTDRGAFTAALRFGGKMASWSGQLDVEGKAVSQVRYQVTNLLTVSLCLDVTNTTDTLTGQINGGPWTAQALAYRAPVFTAANLSPFAGRSTLLIAGSTNGSGPLGHGVATPVVAASGAMTLAGTLADGTALAQACPVAANGAWPLYLPLYRNKGSVLGWLTFTNDPTARLAGQVNWIKPAVPADKIYAGGFTNVAMVLGAAYSPQAMTNFLATNIVACLAFRGVTPEIHTNCLALAAGNNFTGPGVRSLKLALPTGLWTGSYTNPASGKVLPAKFAWLLQNATGGGHVLGTNFSAAIETVPLP